jgi:hypothetical protein
MAGSRGIELLRPRYVRSMLVEADVAYWEVLYDDGTVLCEAEGARYDQIDRARLASFRIIYNGQNVFELFPQGGKSGHHLIYRRRTDITQEDGGRTVTFIVGFGPDGPLFTVDLAHGQYFEDTARVLPSLTPMPGEPDGLLPLAG